MFRVKFSNLKLVLLVLISVLGCSISGKPIETLEQRSALPNSQIFPIPMQSARSLILQGLRLIPERDDPYYQKYGFMHAGHQHGERPAFVAFLAEDIDTALFGKKFFKDQANANDIFVHSMGIAVSSSYFRNSDGPLSYSVKFAISLSPENGNHTKVTVRSFDTSIGNGKEFNLHAFGYIPKSINVAPVRAEEYKLLVYVAHLLGTDLLPLD